MLDKEHMITNFTYCSYNSSSKEERLSKTPVGCVVYFYWLLVFIQLSIRIEKNIIIIRYRLTSNHCLNNIAYEKRNRIRIPDKHIHKEKTDQVGKRRTVFFGNYKGCSWRAVGCTAKVWISLEPAKPGIKSICYILYKIMVRWQTTRKI